MLKRIINITIWTIIGLYTAIVILLHIPFIQTFVGERVADALCHKFGTKVSIGRVDLGFVNRLIIDDTEMQDQQGKQMLRVSRISVKIDLLALANGEIEITSAQFFGLQANLYKATADSKPNFQFVVDSLASERHHQTEDTTQPANQLAHHTQRLCKLARIVACLQLGKILARQHQRTQYQRTHYYKPHN